MPPPCSVSFLACFGVLCVDRLLQEQEMMLIHGKPSFYDVTSFFNRKFNNFSAAILLVRRVMVTTERVCAVTFTDTFVFLKLFSCTT